jgi:hypothetical protein
MTEEKQIEEMARFMCANYDEEKRLCGGGLECDHDCWAYREATHLYNAGYRKQSEGEWKMKVYPITSCSVCGVLRSVEYQQGWNFCPNCGAKMKGGAE